MPTPTASGMPIPAFMPARAAAVPHRPPIRLPATCSKERRSPIRTTGDTESTATKVEVTWSGLPVNASIKSAKAHAAAALPARNTLLTGLRGRGGPRTAIVPWWVSLELWRGAWSKVREPYTSD